MEEYTTTNTSSCKHTYAKTKYYFQDDTARNQIKGVESVSPYLGAITANSTEVQNLAEGVFEDYKTSLQQIEYTITMRAGVKISDDLGFAMGVAYAKILGCGEQLYLIQEDADGNFTAVKGIVSAVNLGDSNLEAPVRTITFKGNLVDTVPEPPTPVPPTPEPENSEA